MESQEINHTDDKASLTSLALSPVKKPSMATSSIPQKFENKSK